MKKQMYIDGINLMVEEAYDKYADITDEFCMIVAGPKSKVVKSYNSSCLKNSIKISPSSFIFCLLSVSTNKVNYDTTIIKKEDSEIGYEILDEIISDMQLDGFYDFNIVNNRVTIASDYTPNLIVDGCGIITGLNEVGLNYMTDLNQLIKKK